jgi:diguanylate cyclase (GGDEF)-like protein
MLDIATLMVCSAVTSFVVAVALTCIWIFDQQEKAVAHWAAAMWVGTVGLLLLAMRAILPEWLGVGVGNMAACLAFAFFWSGFQTFGGRRPTIFAIVAGPVAWALAYFSIDAIHDDVNNRIILMSTILGAYCALVVLTTLAQWKRDRLPSLLAAALVYGTHGMAYLLRIPFALMAPAAMANGTASSPWFAYISLENFAHGIFTTFIFVVLIRERSERHFRRMSEIDMLTGAASRRHFVTQTVKHLNKATGIGALAVIDLDHFKLMNDTNGHRAGDKVLADFSEYCRQMLLPGMSFGRLGGEEFGLFMPDFDSAEATRFMEKVRVGIEGLEIHFEHETLGINASIGVSSLDDCGHDFDRLLAAADDALYLAKDEGRNRVVPFLPSMRFRKFKEFAGVSLAGKPEELRGNPSW